MLVGWQGGAYRFFDGCRHVFLDVRQSADEGARMSELFEREHHMEAVSQPFFDRAFGKHRHRHEVCALGFEYSDHAKPTHALRLLADSFTRGGYRTAFHTGRLIGPKSGFTWHIPPPRNVSGDDDARVTAGAPRTAAPGMVVHETAEDALRNSDAATSAAGSLLPVVDVASFYLAHVEGRAPPQAAPSSASPLAPSLRGSPPRLGRVVMWFDGASAAALWPALLASGVLCDCDAAVVATSDGELRGVVSRLVDQLHAFAKCRVHVAAVALTGAPNVPHEPSRGGALAAAAVGERSTRLVAPRGTRSALESWRDGRGAARRGAAVTQLSSSSRITEHVRKLMLRYELRRTPQIGAARGMAAGVTDGAGAAVHATAWVRVGVGGAGCAQQRAIVVQPGTCFVQHTHTTLAPMHAPRWPRGGGKESSQLEPRRGAEGMFNGSACTHRHESLDAALSACARLPPSHCGGVLMDTGKVCCVPRGANATAEGADEGTPNAFQPGECPASLARVRPANVRAPPRRGGGPPHEPPTAVWHGWWLWESHDGGATQSLLRAGGALLMELLLLGVLVACARVARHANG
jgi:hypothetical protein